MNKMRTYVRRSITIDKPREELYKAWRNEELLARFMAGAESVDVLDARFSKWKVRIPGFGVESWKSEITDDRKNEAISWRTVGATKFDHQGTVHFASLKNGAGSEVTLELDTALPAGRFARTAAWFMGTSPEDHVSQTLRNFKQLMETGEIASNEGPHARMRILTGVGPKVAVAGAVMMAAATFIFLRSRRVGGEA